MKRRHLPEVRNERDLIETWVRKPGAVQQLGRAVHPREPLERSVLEHESADAQRRALRQAAGGPAPPTAVPVQRQLRQHDLGLRVASRRVLRRGGLYTTDDAGLLLLRLLRVRVKTGRLGNALPEAEE